MTLVSDSKCTSRGILNYFGYSIEVVPITTAIPMSNSTEVYRNNYELQEH